MSGTDQIVINTRERAASGDVNDLQSLKDRTLLDSWLEAFQLRTYAPGVAPGEVSQPVVLGGLEAGPSGTDLVVQRGVLLQDSATLSPVPGALDSQYRWSANRASTVIANPAPGSDTWYLIEAQMTNVVASSTTRDIFNTGTGLFVPTLVDKRTERQISFQLLAGTTTNLPLPTGGDWVVIGAVLVPTGGGAIPAANFIDMRPLADDLAPAVRPAARLGMRSSMISMPPAIEPNDFPKKVVVGAEAFVNGRRLWLDTSETGFEPLGAFLNAFREPGTNPQVGSTLSYLYLAPIQGAGTRAIFARNAYAHGGISVINGNSLIVISTNAPGADGERNGSTLSLPAPFSNYIVPIGGAVCIGALHTNVSATLVSMGSGGTNRQLVHFTGSSPIPGWGDSIAPTGGADAISLPDVPVGAKSIEILISWFRNAAGSQGQVLFIQPVGGSAANRWYTIYGDWDTTASVRVTLPAVTSFEIEFDGTNVPISADVSLVGFGM